MERRIPTLAIRNHPFQFSGLYKQCNIKITRHRWKSHFDPWTTTGAIVGWQRFRRTRWWQQRFIWIPWNFDQRFESRQQN